MHSHVCINCVHYGSYYFSSALIEYALAISLYVKLSKKCFQSILSVFSNFSSSCRTVTRRRKFPWKVIFQVKKKTLLQVKKKITIASGKENNCKWKRKQLQVKKKTIHYLLINSYLVITWVRGKPAIKIEGKWPFWKKKIIIRCSLQFKKISFCFSVFSPVLSSFGWFGRNQFQIAYFRLQILVSFNNIWNIEKNSLY